MPKAYSDDLRMKFLEAYAAGRRSLAELVLQVDVSYGYATKIRRQQIETDAMDRPAQSQPGPDLPPFSHPVITGVSRFWFCFESSFSSPSSRLCGCGKRSLLSTSA